MIGLEILPKVKPFTRIFELLRLGEAGDYRMIARLVWRCHHGLLEMSR